MEKVNDIAVVIPAYNPDSVLINLVNELIESGLKNIIVINDGSNEECKNIFETLSNKEECFVINHAVNLGKGRALKTAFNFYLNNFGNFKGIVTVDADGQHVVDDIKNVAIGLTRYPNKLVLGTRDFSKDNIPFRSRFGNVLTRGIFRFVTGLKITDTQTGLRGIPNGFIPSLLKVKGERYEFEMNMLLECKSENIPVEEIGIRTIYIEDNKSSHFNPIIDSIKIYTIFLKYLLSSLTSFGLDIVLFSVFLIMFEGLLPNSYIIVATIASRILSSLYNYFINKNIVFNSKQRNTVYKYYTLSVFQMLASAALVHTIFSTFGNGEIIIKILVDTLLFLISFYIQREWVFKDRGEL